MALPATFRKLVATKISTNFRNVVSIQTVPMQKPGPDEVLVRNRYVGINASDINKTAGRYDPTVNTPQTNLGLESIGNIVEVGSDVKHLKLGQSVCFIEAGAFSEYKIVNSKVITPVPTVKPEYIGLLVSGLTADIALREMGNLKKGETVLITAAAGGTGQFAVQYAKLAGCHVVGTCSTDSKAKFLKEIGCDRAINYKTENLDDVLKKEYPKGIDVVYESVGGDMFHTCLKNLARKGRLIVIGFITGYKEDTMAAPTVTSVEMYMILAKAVTLSGFFLLQYMSKIPESLARQVHLFDKGLVSVQMDSGQKNGKGPFKGMEEIVDALEYLYTGKSAGKVFVEVNEALPSPRI
jgi:NADPH-dependent curcumin reductase CurA